MTPEPAPTPRSLSVEAVRRVIEIISRPEARQQARLELRVDWDDLGVERVAVHWQGDQARVDVSCRTEATAEALRSTEGLLRQRLANMGVELSELRTSCEAGGGQRSAYDRSDSWRPPQRWQAYGVALPYVTRSTGTTNSARGRTHGVDVWV
jgi:flagellar hook-length control protein FliK